MAERAKAARRERRRVELERRRTQGRHAPRAAWVLRVLAIAFLVSGGAGLIHEVVWSRLLGHLFGATSLAISTVLAAFMAGLALGSYWIGTRSGRFADRRRAYAWLEIGIGVLALLVPLLLDVVEPVYGWLWRRFHFSFAVFGMLRFAVAGAILIGPTIMMGATLPVLAGYTAALQGRRLAPEWLYTLNLAGAVLGVVAGGFVLMPSIGVWGTIIAGASLNLLVGATVLGLPAVDEQRVPADAGGSTPSTRAPTGTWSSTTPGGRRRSPASSRCRRRSRARSSRGRCSAPGRSCRSSWRPHTPRTPPARRRWSGASTRSTPWGRSWARPSAGSS